LANIQPGGCIPQTPSVAETGVLGALGCAIGIRGWLVGPTGNREKPRPPQ